jgi:hypothetical protein
MLLRLPRARYEQRPTSLRFGIGIPGSFSEEARVLRLSVRRCYRLVVVIIGRVARRQQAEEVLIHPNNTDQRPAMRPRARCHQATGKSPVRA